METFDQLLDKFFPPQKKQLVNPEYWFSCRGRELISNMSTNHINNCIKLINSGSAKKQFSSLKHLEAELKRRERHPDQILKHTKIPLNDYKKKIFTDNFIDENFESIDLDLLVEFQELTTYILKKYKKKLSWKLIYKYQRIPDGYILEHYKEIKWDLIIYNEKYDDSFFEEWAEFIDWNKLAQIKKLSYHLIEYFYKAISFNVLCQHQTLSEHFIENHIKSIPWDFLSKSLDNYSDEFIKKYEKKINWNNASSCPNLSLDIIKKFRDRVNWSNIFRNNKNITFDFVIENKDFINFGHASQYLKNYFGKNALNKTQKNKSNSIPGSNKIILKLGAKETISPVDDMINYYEMESDELIVDCVDFDELIDTNEYTDEEYTDEEYTDEEYESQWSDGF